MNQESRVKLENHKEVYNYEEIYAKDVDLGYRKKFGQFFTPISIAESMASWINLNSPKYILDPSAGTGLLIDRAHEQNLNANIIGVEIDPKLVSVLTQRFKSNKRVSIVLDDFLNPKLQPKIDAVIANPPYIRHHEFKVSDDKLELIQPLNTRIPKTSNSYIYFILKSFNLLSQNGRAAFLIPSDWLNANYGKFLKEFLINSRAVSRMVLFQHKFNAFEDNLSTALLMFIDKSQRFSNCEMVILDESFPTELIKQLGDKRLPAEFGPKTQMLDLSSLPPRAKWLHFFDTDSIKAPSTWISLEFNSATSRGIATGANSYFHINPSVLIANNLSKERARKCIGRAKDVKGLVFTLEDFQNIENLNGLSYLLDLDESHSADKKYIEYGLKLNLPKRFLLKQRRPWYKQEIRVPAPIWIGVFGRDGIRFIWNKAGIHNLTTFHGLYPEMPEEDIGVLVALLNSSSLQGLNRSSERAYGSGLRKVEPRDVLQMKIPNISLLRKQVKAQLAQALEESDILRRNGELHWRNPIDAVIRSCQNDLQ